LILIAVVLSVALSFCAAPARAATAGELASYQFSFGQDEDFRALRGIAFDASGNIIVLGGRPSLDNPPGFVYLRRYTPSGVLEQTYIDEPVSSTDVFAGYLAMAPDGSPVTSVTPIAIDRDGARYTLLDVLDREQGRVVKTNATGEMLAQWDAGPWADGLLAGMDNLLYVSRIMPGAGAGLWGGSPHYVDRYSLDGALLGTTLPASDIGIWYPVGAVDPSGNLYMTTYDWHGYGRIEKCAANSEVLSILAGIGDQLFGYTFPLAVSSTGRLAVGEYSPDSATGSRVDVFQINPSRFSDIPMWFWAGDDIESAADAGVVSGFPDGTYRPALPVDRAQMAVYLARALAGGDANVPPGPSTPTFWDVPVDHWAYEYIEYCTARGAVRGVFVGCYLPGKAVDRAQMAVFLAMAVAAGGPTPSRPLTATFDDVPTSFWAFPYIEYLRQRGVVSGYPDGLYHPEIVVTRDQMAVYVARAFSLQ
jgi:hypothetical protein